MDQALIVNIDRLKSESYIDKNVTNSDIRVAVKFVQDQVIEHIVGTCLFDRLKHIVCSCEIDHPCNSIYRELLDGFLFPIFVYAVPAQLSIPKSYQIRNVGTIHQSTDQTQQSTLSDIKYLNSYYKNNADFYMNRAIKFLKCNRYCFPELCTCACSWCVDSPLSKQPNTSLNLNIIDVKRRV